MRLTHCNVNVKEFALCAQDGLLLERGRLACNQLESPLFGVFL